MKGAMHLFFIQLIIKQGLIMKAIRVVKVAECLNLSAKYKIKFHIGIDEQGAIIIRVAENEGGGYFSPEWVKLQTILDKLDSAKTPLTSFTLQGITEGKSSNTIGFLWAAIYSLGLVERDIDNPRVYVSCDPKPVIESIDALIKSGADIKVDHIPDGRKTVILKPESAKKSNSPKSTQ
ncbi:hypothetical protein ASG44_07145 [Methylophilus sp. Leaf459]|nr:hypothetical protein ASG34_07170 [Methylophilus sp. Leaf416]KQT56699.1 hypothetical protein ASG44_07145 [Methylophilus sp. Leaf459]